MTTLHPTPQTREVVREQIRIVGLALSRQAAVVGAVLGGLTLLIVIDIVRGSAATWFDSDDWAPVGLVSFLLPFAVWRMERRFGPSFLWTLPVDRRRLALARVFAGWVWLTWALVAFMAWQVVLAKIAGIRGAETMSLVAFPGSTALYLLGSALVLGLRHPLRWLLGTAAGFFLLGMLNRALDSALDPFLQSRAVHSALETGTAWWPLVIFLWLAAGLAALWLAVARHGERRRH